MGIEVLNRASVKQQIPELILTGEKTEEYRKKRTHIRERVYLCAGKKYHKGFPGFAEEEASLLPR